MKLFLALLFICNTAFSQEVAFLAEGDMAPFRGILLHPETANKLVERAKESDALRAALDTQVDMMVEIQKEKIALEFSNAKLKQTNQEASYWIGFLVLCLGLSLGK